MPKPFGIHIYYNWPRGWTQTTRFNVLLCEFWSYFGPILFYFPVLPFRNHNVYPVPMYVEVFNFLFGCRAKSLPVSQTDFGLRFFSTAGTVKTAYSKRWTKYILHNETGRRLLGAGAQCYGLDAEWPLKVSRVQKWDF